MKIQRNTLILALAAFGLASGIYIQQLLTAPETPGEIRTEGSEPLFDFDEADVTQFTIRRPDLTLSLKKREAESGAETETDGEDAIANLEAELAAAQTDWALTEPEQIPASDGAVAFLLNLLATGDRRDSFTLTDPSQSRLAEFGFDQPLGEVDITLADGTARSLILGDSNFDESGIYAAQTLKPSSQSIEVFIVDSSLEPALLRPLEEWRYTAELPDGSVAVPEAEDLPSEGLPPDSLDAEVSDTEALDTEVLDTGVSGNGPGNGSGNGSERDGQPE